MVALSGAWDRRDPHKDRLAGDALSGLIHMTDVFRGRKYFRVMLKKWFRIYESYVASVGQFSHERVFFLSALGQSIVRQGEITSHGVRLSCEQVHPEHHRHHAERPRGPHHLDRRREQPADTPNRPGCWRRGWRVWCAAQDRDALWRRVQEQTAGEWSIIERRVPHGNDRNDDLRTAQFI